MCRPAQAVAWVTPSKNYQDHLVTGGEDGHVVIWTRVLDSKSDLHKVAVSAKNRERIWARVGENIWKKVKKGREALRLCTSSCSHRATLSCTVLDMSRFRGCLDVGRYIATSVGRTTVSFQTRTP